MTTTHRDAVETLAAERYLLGEMSEAERHEFEAHYFACAECAADMRIASRLRGDAGDVFGMERATATSGPAGVLRWRFLRSAAVPWAAAATLALAVVYQGSTGSGDDEARAVAPLALRPATRGAVPDLPLPGKGEVVALALDVNIGAEGSELSYQVEREDGAVAAAGAARVPSPGTPLLLLIPAGDLRPGGSFVVRLTPGGSAAAPPAEYRFNAVLP